MHRRDFLRAAGGSAAGAAALGAGAGGAAAQEERPDFGGLLDEVDGGYEDLRGQDEATIEVGAQGNGGAYAFSPAGCWVDPGTTLLFEWTGEGGAHNVVATDGPAGLDSGDPVDTSGVEYEFTAEEDAAGITQYVCQPHESLGMRGAIAVGDVETVETGGGGGSEGPTVPGSALSLGVAAATAMVSTLGLTYVFLKYGGESRVGSE